MPSPAVDLELNETQLLVQKTARDFATRVIAPQAAELDATERFPAEIAARAWPSWV